MLISTELSVVPKYTGMPIPNLEATNSVTITDRNNMPITCLAFASANTVCIVNYSVN